MKKLLSQIPTGAQPPLPSYLQKLADTVSKLITKVDDESENISKAADKLRQHETVQSNPHNTTKAQIGLGSLPNAKSDSTSSDSSDQLATSRAVKNVRDYARELVRLSAVPEPDFHLPLISNLNLREGFGDVSFTRASKATYINKSGVLTLAGENEPRFEKEGILIEGASTNNCFPSQQIGATPWSSNGTERSVDLNAGLAPDGTMTASLITTGVSGAGYFRQQSFPNSEAENITASVWLRGVVGGETISLRATGTTKIVTLTTEWVRYSVTRNQNPTSTSLAIYQSGNSPISFYAWGAQGEDLPFASSYIPTEGEPVTRAADDLTVQREGNIPFNGSPISISYALYCNHSQSIRPFRTTAQTAIGVGETNNNGRQFRGFVSEFAIVAVQLSNDGDANNGHQTMTFSGVEKLGMRGDIHLYYNREQVASGDVLISRSDFSGVLRIGGGVDLNDNIFGHIRDFRIWHYELSSVQIAGLN